MTKVILITGAASGIGRACAHKMLAEGYTVYGGDKDFKGMADLAEQGLYPLDMNVCDEHQVSEGIDTIIANHGKIDGLLANAGYASIGLYETVTIEEAQKQFDTNVWGVARTIQAVLPHMRQAAPQGQGHIVIMSSGVGKLAMPGLSWYSASKHALEGLGDALRMEMAACFPGIKVALIEPGFIPTNIVKNSLPSWQQANASPAAEVYQDEMRRLKKNFTKLTEQGSAVETISQAVFEAFEAKRPKLRYAPNLETRSGIFAEKMVESTGLLDRVFISMMLGK